MASTNAMNKNKAHIDVPIIWILGGPGSGKGTQCAEIVKKYKFVHLSTGDLLRAEVASGSPKGQILADLMREGKLVPNDDVLFLLEKAVINNAQNAPGFLIDGYPRQKDQGVAFENKIGPADLIIFFDCTDDTLVKRILSRAAASEEKRADDNETAIRTRVATFRSNTNGILSQYTHKTLTINAERSVEDIFCDVSCALDCLIKRKNESLRKTA